MGKKLLFLHCVSKLGPGSITPPQPPNVQERFQHSITLGYQQELSVLTVFSPHSIWRSSEDKALPFTYTLWGGEWCRTVRFGSSRLHIQEVPYRSALVHSKPQAPECGCLHSLLHPSLEPKAFHHEASECFLSCTGRRYLLQTSCLPSRSLLSRSTESLWNHLHLQVTNVGELLFWVFFACFPIGFILSFCIQMHPATHTFPSFSLYKVRLHRILENGSLGSTSPSGNCEALDC